MIWRPIAGYPELYEISDHGAVRNARGKLRKQKLTYHGYCRIDLYRWGMRADHYVHRLVAEAFLGPRHIDQEVDHLNEWRWDNRVENLKYVTRHENMSKRWRARA